MTRLIGEIRLRRREIGWGARKSSAQSRGMPLDGMRASAHRIAPRCRKMRLPGEFGSRRVVRELPQFPGLGGCDLLGLGFAFFGFAVCNCMVLLHVGAPLRSGLAGLAPVAPGGVLVFPLEFPFAHRTRGTLPATDSLRLSHFSHDCRAKGKAQNKIRLCANSLKGLPYTISHPVSFRVCTAMSQVRADTRSATPTAVRWGTLHARPLLQFKAK